MKAYALRVGSVLPNGERVARIEELEGLRLAAVTEGGRRWEFRYMDEVRWPRRPDGSTVDWVLADRDPLPAELAVGDLLPPADWRDPRLDPDWPDYGPEDVAEVKAQLRPFSQEVRAVQALGHKATQVYLRQAGVTTRWLFPNGQPVRFPAPAHRLSVHSGRALPGTKRPGYQRKPLDEVPTSCEYENVVTGRRARFAINPAGRGRYPAAVRDYDPEGEGVMKPPRGLEPRSQSNPFPRAFEWRKWLPVEGTGDPHPMDPRA